jgi:uncharacterized membrane protein
MRERIVQLVILACAVAGVAIAGYLTFVHYTNTTLACTRSGLINCDAVTHSSFSLVPGTALPITLPGIAWFAVSGLAALVALGRSKPRWLAAGHALLGTAGVIGVLYLVYAELVVIHGICEWCTAVHALVLLTFVLALHRWQRSTVDTT